MANELPSSGESAFLGDSARNQAALPPLSKEEKRTLVRQQDGVETLYNNGPHATDNAVGVLRAAAGVVSNFFPPAGLALGAVATLVDVGGSVANGDTLGHVARTAGLGAVHAGVNAIPVVGVAQVALGVGDSFVPDDAADRARGNLMAKLGIKTVPNLLGTETTHPERPATTPAIPPTNHTIATR